MPNDDPDYTVKAPGNARNPRTEPVSLSVVVPALNEETALGWLLDYLSGLPGVGEVVVVDGGSTDGTADFVTQHPAARLVRSEPGRGLQLRAGASRATGDALLFLHADVVPPKDVAAQIKRALDEGYVGGNFRLRYPDGGMLGRWLELVVVPLYRRLGRYYGDSGFFVRRDAYEAFGGFPHVPIMEDVIFTERMESYGPTAYLPGPMESSARRWKGRPLRTLLLWAGMQTAYNLGVSPWRLARFYKQDTGGSR